MTDSPDDDPVPAEPADPDTASEPGRQQPGRQLSAGLVATLVAIPVMVLAGFITFAALRFSGGTDSDDAVTPIDSYATQAAAASDCAKLSAALPRTFPGFGDRTITGDTVTWPADKGGGPVRLRCGVTRPADFSPSSSLQVVHPVQWFLTDTVEGTGQAFVSVDHRPYVALWLPIGAGNAPITDVSAAIDNTLPRGPLDFG